MHTRCHYLLTVSFARKSPFAAIKPVALARLFVRWPGLY